MTTSSRGLCERPIDISFDRGGTFTDIFVYINGIGHIFKILSVDPANYNDASAEVG